MTNPTPAEVLNFTKTMQRVDAILGNPIRLINTPEEYQAQVDELTELLETRLSVYA